MSRQDERERVRQRMGALADRVGASRTAGRRGAGVDSAPSSSRDEHESRSAAAPSGRWDLDRVPVAPARSEDDDVGTVRSPIWLDEPVLRRWWEHVVPQRFRGTRLDPGRRGVRTLALVGSAAMIVAAVVAFRERPVAQAVPPLPTVRPNTTSALGVSNAPNPMRAAVSGAAPTSSPGAAELVVSVVGLVRHAGLVRLPDGSRVADALAAAGGSTEGADLTGLNLAQRVIDGDQVLVGAPAPTGSASGPPQLGSMTIGAGTRAPGSPSGSAQSGGAGKPSGAGKPGGAAAKVDLNTAAESDLDALPGVGPVTAGAIIAWRTTNGRFTSVDQLAEVDGIGPARLARLHDLVTV